MSVIILKETERGRKRKEEKEGVILVLHQKKSCKEVYVCMKFSGYSHSGFGDNATFKNGEISLLTMEKFNRSESVQKIHVTRG